MATGQPSLGYAGLWRFFSANLLGLENWAVRLAGKIAISPAVLVCDSGRCNSNGGCCVRIRTDFVPAIVPAGVSVVR